MPSAASASDIGGYTSESEPSTVYVTENPPEDQIQPVARALGSYVAEVYRIFNGGKWGWVIMESGAYPGIQAANGATFLPLEKALDRIKTGESPDIWEYFQLLSEAK